MNGTLEKWVKEIAGTANDNKSRLDKLKPILDSVKEIDELTDDNKSRLDKLEPLVKSVIKMSDERYANVQSYMRAILGGVLITFLTIVAKIIFKF